MYYQTHLIDKGMEAHPIFIQQIIIEALYVLGPVLGIQDILVSSRSLYYSE